MPTGWFSDFSETKFWRGFALADAKIPKFHGFERGGEKLEEREPAPAMTY